MAWSTWSLFPESPESTDALSEADTFQQLEHVINDISAAAFAYLTKLTGAEPVQQFFYTNNPYRTRKFLCRDSASRPDGYFLTYDPHDTASNEKPRWWDIGPLSEFKKRSGETNAADVRGATLLVSPLYTHMRQPSGHAEGHLGHESRHARRSSAPRSLWLYHREHDDSFLVLRSLSGDS